MNECAAVTWECPVGALGQDSVILQRRKPYKMKISWVVFVRVKKLM